MNWQTRALLLHAAIFLSACTAASDRPSPRPDDQPKVPVNRSSAARPVANTNQHPTLAFGLVAP